MAAYSVKMSLNKLRAMMLKELEVPTDSVEGKDIDLELLRASKQLMQRTLAKGTQLPINSAINLPRKATKSVPKQISTRKMRVKTASKSPKTGRKQPLATFLTSVSHASPTFLSSKQRQLFSIVQANNPRALRSLSHLLSPSDLNLTDSKGLNPLYYAAENGLKVTKELVRLGASVDGRGKKSPLTAALVADQKDVAEYLVRHGADVTRRNLSNCDPPSLLSQRLGLHPDAPNPFTSPSQFLRSLRHSSTSRALPSAPTKQQPRAITLLTLPKWIWKERVRLDIKQNGPLYPSTNRSGVDFQGEVLLHGKQVKET